MVFGAIGFRVDGMYGVFHGPALVAMDARHGGSIIDAQNTDIIEGVVSRPQ